MDNLPIATPEGYFVSREHQRIAEIIIDYNSELRLVFMPPTERKDDPDAKPFAVAHIPQDGEPYLVAFFDVCDERILEFLFLNDQSKHDVQARVNARDAAVEAINLKKQVELEEERRDLVAHIVRSPLHRYKHNGVVYE